MVIGRYMAKQYNLDNLRIIHKLDDDKAKTISYETVSKLIEGRSFWSRVRKYLTHWERNSCKDILIDFIWNPDNVPSEQVCKWLVDLHKSEGAYKSELLENLSQLRVK